MGLMSMFVKRSPAQQLCSEFARVAAEGGASHNTVVDAAANLIVFTVRQAFADKRRADEAVDTLYASMKSALSEHHYDSVTGKRRRNTGLIVP